MKRRPLRLPALLLSCCGWVSAQTSPPPAVTAMTTPVMTPVTTATPNAQAVYDEGARLLKTYYFGFSAVNLDEQVRLYQTQLEAACGAEVTTCPAATGETTLKNLYRSVGDRHLYALTASEFARTLSRYEAAPQKVSTFGLTLGPVGDKGALVLDVLTGSAAERAGILPGDLLTLAQGEPLPPDLELQAVLSLRVRHGTSQRTVTLERTEVDPVALPTLYTPADAPEGVQVLRIPSFAFTERVGPRVHALVKHAQQAGKTALIVDLRRGPGGSNYECEMAAAAFTGPFKYQSHTPRGRFPGGWLGSTSLDVAERAFFDVTAPATQQHLAYPLKDSALWKGKTAVLVDARSASCHEYMAYFMQQQGVPVIGENTAGLMNTASILVALPGGGGVALTAVRTAHPDGTLFPAFLTPDVPVTPNWQSMADGQADGMLQKAYELLGTR